MRAAIGSAGTLLGIIIRSIVTVINIFKLYDEIFCEDTPGNMDLLHVQKGREPNSSLGNWKTLSKQQNKPQFLYEIFVPRMNNEASRIYFRGDLEDIAHLTD